MNLLILPALTLVRLVWILFVLFTFFHLYANYQAVTCVVMETININRLHILVHHYLKTGDALVPFEVNMKDPVIRS